MTTMMVVRMKAAISYYALIKGQALFLELSHSLVVSFSVSVYLSLSNLIKPFNPLK